MCVAPLKLPGPCPFADAATTFASVASARSNMPVSLPLLITAMRSDSAITSSRSDVANRMPSPSRDSLRMVRKTSALAPTSMPRLGSSISSTFGLVSSALPITTFCWLPPESDVTSLSGLATLIASSLTIEVTACLSSPPRMWNRRANLRRLASVRLLATERIETRPFALAVFRDQRQPAADAPRRVALPHLLAVDEDLAGRLAMPAHDAVEQLAAAGAHQAVDAENLAGPQRQRHMVDGQPAGGARQADVLGAEDLLARLVVVGLGEVLGVGADHLPHDPLRVDVLHLLLAGDVAVAQHGDVVADADQLFQPVRDVDDRHALRLEVGDHLEQHLDLGGTTAPRSARP